MKDISEYPTPRTTAMLGAPDPHCNGHVPSDFARSLERENTVLREALEKLVTRLDVIHEDERYKAVWFSYYNHGGDYTNGPQYKNELDEARAVLNATKP